MYFYINIEVNDYNEKNIINDNDIILINREKELIKFVRSSLYKLLMAAFLITFCYFADYVIGESISSMSK